MDVSWIYGNRCITIPKIGDSFSVLVCDTYYSESKIEYCYGSIGKQEKEKMIVPKNGIRICKAEPGGDVLNEQQIPGYNGFIQNEFLISDNTQILPVYAINLRRIEYI